MKINHCLIVASALVLDFAHFTDAQCPQICDSNQNTALGDSALVSLTTGSANTAVGNIALQNNTEGFQNTASGFISLFTNTTGNRNTATGGYALLSNTTGSDNTASGANALLNNTNGIQNTASGVNALYSNTSGNYNTADGDNSLLSNTTGINNTAEGGNALPNNTSGSNNIAVGFSAGSSLTTGNNNIDIGNAGVAGESKTTRIGTKNTQRATFIAGISGATVPTGIPVIIDNNGRLGTTTSSARFKDHIQPMNKASEAILELQPVTFRYKHDLDPAAIPQFGLVAEDVAKIDPDLVDRDDEGNPYTVRYEAVNAMLLNEFLKEHRAMQELKSIVAKQAVTIAQQQEDFETTSGQQQKEIRALTATLKEQAAQIQKVSARVEVTQRAPQIVDNKR